MNKIIFFAILALTGCATKPRVLELAADTDVELPVRLKFDLSDCPEALLGSIDITEVQDWSDMMSLTEKKIQLRVINNQAYFILKTRHSNVPPNLFHLCKSGTEECLNTPLGIPNSGPGIQPELELPVKLYGTECELFGPANKS